MIKDQIIISKDTILGRYNNLDTKTRCIIEKLYEISEFDKEYKLEDFDIKIKKIKIDQKIKNINKNYNELDFAKKRVGVYIFLNEENIPVYIGFGGRGNSNDLRDRILNQFSARDNGYSNLVEKIIKVEKKVYINLKNKISDIDDLIKKLEERKKAIKENQEIIPEIDFSRLQDVLLSYTSSLIIINCGGKEEENIKFAQALEMILIALFNSKYNG